MDTSRFREWVFVRQGLDRLRAEAARDVLAQTGWQRSVGGINPYVALWARTGVDRSDMDRLALDLQVFELPAVRGCTYVLPAEHFALGLALGRGFGSVTEIATARKLSVQDEEVEALKTAVVEALANGALDPAELKTVLGNRVRNLGEEGKKRGLTTTLPLALGLLQTEGRIRRKPTNGRFDTQRYAYERWEPALAIDALWTDEAAGAECARLYFSWTGAATLKEFREFTAFTVRRAQASCDRAGIVSFAPDTDLLGLPGARADFDAFEPLTEPTYRLVSSLDSFLLLRRGCQFWLTDEDRTRMAPTDKGMLPLSGLGELWSHAILDRGRLVGLWEFDPEEGKIAWMTWIAPNDALLASIEAAERYVRDDLGDARSFSLDSPKSRSPRIAALRELQQASI